MPVQCGTKGETLQRVADRLSAAKVLPQVRTTVAAWQADPDCFIEKIRRRGWLQRPLIVRSSAIGEDREGQSLAGHFRSVGGVLGQAKLRDAVASVIASFGQGTPEDQVFVQPELTEVTLSGVAFSRDPNTGGPYYVINYDDTTSSTSSVTSGQSNQVKTFYAVKHQPGRASPRMTRVVALLDELERLLGTDAIDVEFAFDSDDAMYLLQVRPLHLAHATAADPELHGGAIRDVFAKVEQGNQEHPYLFGSRTVYGVMPDWNPAEIIGIRPRPLALSLYKELVTDNVWAYQRNSYGYKNLRSFPLLVSFHGLPYIDVRVSFNSFIPADVEPELANRLANYYIDRLVESPAYHDKVEFEIVYSCYTLDLPERLKKLHGYDFSESDVQFLAESLRCLTNRIIHNEDGLWRRDIARIETLESNYRAINTSNLDTFSKIYWLIEDCKRYGTLPFAGLARAGFIAVQMLRSLVQVEVIDWTEYNRFFGSLHTISSQIGADFRGLPREEFLKKYGHLRPGTYDILSDRYDERPDLYFDWDRQPCERNSDCHAGAEFTLSLDQLNRVQRLLREHRLDHDAVSLLNFIKGAIEGREFAKFVFTRSVSEVLSRIKAVAAEHGFSADDASYLDVASILGLYASSLDPAAVVKGSVENGRSNYELTRQLVLPPLITRPQDVLAFEVPPCEPNFITIGKVVSHVTFLDEAREKLSGGILFIPTADPGYDWIFSHDIGGLVTMYGGTNSHMAIRAAELGIPAVIGVGEQTYHQWAKAEQLDIDCANKRVRTVRTRPRWNEKSKVA